MRYLTAFILLTSNFIYAQKEFTVHNFFTTKDGLSNNTIYVIKQDARGFLWVGTKEGLSRFDGYQFEKYFAGKSSANSLSSNSVFDILEYRPGHLLIATSNGLSVFNTITSSFENNKIKFPPIRAGGGTIINSLFRDKNSQIWVNHSGELDILDTNLNYAYRFSDVSWAKGLKGIVTQFAEWQQDAKGNIWLPGHTGIQIIDFAAKQVWNSHNNPRNLPYLEETSIRSLFLDEQNGILLYAPWGMGLFKYNLRNNKIEQQLFQLPRLSEKSCVNKIVPNKDDLICVTGGGLFRVNEQSLQYEKINSQASFALLQTNQSQSYWQGGENGLLQLTDSTYVRSLIFSRQHEEDDNCGRLLKATNNLFYGLYRSKKLVIADPSNNSSIEYPVPGNTFATDECEDEYGNIWLATAGVQVFDHQKKSFFFPSFLPPELKTHAIRAVFSDKDKNIWLTTTNPFQIFRIKPTEKSAEKIVNTAVDHYAEKYGRKIVTSISEDEERRIWFCSIVGGGILCFDKKSNTWQSFPVTNSHVAHILDRGFNSADFINGFLWLTDFYGNGLFRYDIEKDSVDIFTRNEGLMSNYILSVCKGDSGKLFLVSENGITVFSTKDFSTKKIRFSNLKIPSYKDVATVYDSVSHVITNGLSDRLVFFNENLFWHNLISPTPLVTSVSVNNIKEPYDPAQNFSLPYDHNNVAINFTAIDFSEAANLRFAYKLAGVDKNWQTADLIRTAQYANLAPGNYSFLIKTKYENGDWNTPVQAFKFTIIAPFWDTWWFQVSVAIVIVLIIGSIFWYRIRNIRKQANLKQKIAETEMMALRAQMNPHFIFNCITAIDNLIQSDEKDKATTYLAKFARLIRNVLDSSKNEVVPFHKDYQAIDLFLQLEKFRCSDKFTYELRSDKELLDGDYKVPPLLVQPFLENAIHHGLMNKEGADKKLTISVALVNNYIQYIIIDNGVGRKRALEIKQHNKPGHVSYGIEISAERIQLYNKAGETKGLVITDLFEHSIPAGTKVEVNINLNNHHYA